MKIVTVKWMLQRVELLSNGCVLWTGRKLGKRGYGRVHVGTFPNRHDEYAHRLMYELLTGTRIPKGKVIDHLCANTSCVNPAHMDVTTSSENTRRHFERFGCHRRRTKNGRFAKEKP